MISEMLTGRMNQIAAELRAHAIASQEECQMIKTAPEMLKALADADLRCTQARIASTIGKKTGQADFLRNELERIQAVLVAAIEKATDKQDREKVEPTQSERIATRIMDLYETRQAANYDAPAFREIVDLVEAAADQKARGGQ